MFDVSLPEFVLCAIIGLLVLGPQRLPKVAAELGKWVGRARRTATQLRRQLEREIELSELETPPERRRPAAPPEQSPAAAPTRPTESPSAAATPPETVDAEPTIAPPTEPKAELDETAAHSAAGTSSSRPDKPQSG